MKPPTCKVCQKAHWTYDGHSVSDTEVPEYVKEMARGALGDESLPPMPVETIPVRVRAKVVDHVPTPPPDVPTSLQPDDVREWKPTVTEKPCNTCNKPVTGYGKVCNACRQRAYRGRNR